MYSKSAARASARVAKSAPWTSSFFSDANKLSIGALSQQSARRLMLQVIPCGHAQLGELLPYYSPHKGNIVRRGQDRIVDGEDHGVGPLPHDPAADLVDEQGGLE